MNDLKSFVTMKIDMVEAVIEELENDQGGTEYQNGAVDGYLESASLELQTLNQILESLE